MTHDRRAEDGTYRCCTPAETRAKRARDLTQTWEGPFTHDRNESARRMDVKVSVPQDTPFFKNKRFNRDQYRPNVVKG